MNDLVQSLIRHDAETFFAQHCEKLFDQWVLLLQMTTLPANTTCTDNRVLEVFGALNTTIANGGVFSRLAYVRLTQTLATLSGEQYRDRQTKLAEYPRRKAVAMLAWQLIYILLRRGLH